MTYSYEIITRAHKINPLISWFSNLKLTGWFILINILVFFLFNILLSLLGIYDINNCSQNICKFVVLNPQNFFNNGYFWTAFTSIFLHANFFHLFVNMFSLFFLGNFLEMLIGKKRYFWLYLISGLFASIFFASLAFYFGNNSFSERIFGSSNDFALGASGAIFALAGVLALLTPKKKVYLIMGPLIALILQSLFYISIKNSALLSFLDMFVMIYIFISIFALISFNSGLQKLALPLEMSFSMIPIFAIVPLIIVGLFVKLPIGNMAHLGGLIAGMLYATYLKYKYKNKTKLIERTFR